MKSRKSSRLRRARTIHAHWEDDRLVFTNWRTRSSVEAGPVVADLLCFLGKWRKPREVVAFLGDYPASAVRASIGSLLAAGLLVREGTVDAHLDQSVSRSWSQWHPAGEFHYSTRDVAFVPEDQMVGLLKGFLTESTPPSPFKLHPGAPRLNLPKPNPAVGEFATTLMARRTHREFSKEPVLLAQLSTLLHHTFGVTGTVQSPAFGKLIHKTSPSGGARHPIEAYVVALRVQGLAPGLYHYAPRRNQLELLRKGSFQRQVAGWCADQSFVAGAAAVVFMTAVLPRVSWKYRFGRAYRIVLLDAGHLGQTFCLTATWLGLGPFCTAAIRDTLVEEVLGVDGVDEVALYVAGVGVPVACT